MADLRNPQGTLLIINFDGVLVPHMRGGLLPPSLVHRLRELSEFFSIAVFSGRSVEDLKENLKFDPAYIIGDHGLEGLPTWNRTLQRLRKIPQNWRKQLEEHPENLPRHAGVFIENRRSSIALHYRRTSRKHLARRELLKLVLSLKPVPRVIPGKCVLHLLPDEAPNRFHALEELIKVSKAPKALLIGFEKDDPDFFFGLPEKSELAELSASRAHTRLGRWSEKRDLQKYLRKLMNGESQKRKGAFAPLPKSTFKAKQDQFFKRTV